MKELTIIFIILVIIIGGAVYIDKYLENTSQELLGMLEDLKEKVKSDSNLEEIKSDANSIYDKWKETEAKWAFTVLHSELDSIETSLTRMKTQIEEGEFNKSIEEINTSIFLVGHISEKEKFCLKNIF